MVYYLASNATKRFSYTSLAKTIGIKHTETVKNYLEYLENTYLLFQVMKFDWSVKKQIIIKRKFISLIMRLSAKWASMLLIISGNYLKI